jgi:hypothetical protein
MRHYVVGFPRRVNSASRPLTRIGIVLLGLHFAATVAAAECPRSAAFTSASRGTTLDVGWTGLGHGLELGTLRFSVGLGACSSRGDGTCGSCPVTGLADEAGQRRCTGDPARSCRTEADCDGAGWCRIFPSAPIPVALGGGAAWCVLTSVGSGVQGSIDAATGQGSLDLPLQIAAFDGALGAPCPRCVGDRTPADGVRDGVCDGGRHRDERCDAASSADATSLDCPPADSATFGTIAKAARSLALTTGARTRALDAASPLASRAGHTKERAACGVCSEDPTRACASAADCDGGTCGAGNGAATAPNACENGLCSSTDGVLGECTNGPFDRTCAADPARSCVADTDCPAPNDRCQTRLRRCFPGGGKIGDGVSARGSAESVRQGKARSTLAGLFCVPGGRNAVTNELVGLPGLGRATLPGTWTLRSQAVEVLP